MYECSLKIVALIIDNLLVICQEKIIQIVKVVEHFADLQVKVVNSFPDREGRWQFVYSFHDFTIQYVDSFPDFTIKFVN